MRRYLKYLRLAGVLFLSGLALGLVVVVAVYLYVAPSLPAIDGLSDVRLQVPLRIYTKEHQLLGEFGEKRRSPKSLEEIPLQLRQAFLAAEDDRFYEHPGIDYQGILRAVAQLILTGRRGQGGSTITMQLARNFYLSPEKTYIRKLKELFLSLKIEHELTKDKILELYLNKIYLGNRAYGVAAAAQVYYGKSLAELDLAQISMIAGLPKAPSRYNPIINPDRATIRRNYVLKRMNELNFISESDMRWAQVQQVSAGLHQSPIELKAPYIAEMVRSEMISRYGDDAYTMGLNVYTSIQSRLQTAANMALTTSLIDYDRRHGYRGVEGYYEIKIDPDPVTPELHTANPEEPASADLTPMAGLIHRPDGTDDAPENLVEQVAAEMQLWEKAYFQGQAKQWDKVLSSHVEQNGLLAALVLEVSEKSAKVYLKGDRIIALNWAGLEWARKFKTVNKQGVAPRQVSDIFNVGDIVRIQRDAEGLWRLGQLPDVEGALLAMAPNDGAIRALVGGFDFRRSSFNRAIQAKRQAGSSFKPFIYSAALEKSYTPASIINDAPVVFHDSALEGMWRPENYSGKFYGPTRLRVALMKSRNLVSIRILRSIGVGYATRYAARFGFNRSDLRKDLSLALGSSELTPIELGTGFSVFANGGYRVKPYFIQKVTDIDGNTLFEADPDVACVSCVLEQEASSVKFAGIETANTETQETSTQPAVEMDDELEQIGKLPKQAKRVIEERNAYLMTTILRDVVKHGTARRARALGRKDLAGKTGTTNDQRDAWFNGFNPDLVATTWVGFDQLKPLGDKETGSRAALPMWIKFMREALRGVPEKPLQRPEGLVEVKINSETGKLAAPGDPKAIFETFRSERAPEKEGASGAAPDEGAGDVPEHLF